MGNRKDIGYYGERVAAKALLKRGYRLLEHNYTIRGGELDLILEKGDEIVFVEVKTRRHTRFGSALESITPQKQRRLKRAAEVYLCSLPDAERDIRFFAVAVILDADDRVLRTEIYEDIFS